MAHLRSHIWRRRPFARLNNWRPNASNQQIIKANQMKMIRPGAAAQLCRPSSEFFGLVERQMVMRGAGGGGGVGVGCARAWPAEQRRGQVEANNKARPICCDEYLLELQGGPCKHFHLIPGLLAPCWRARSLGSLFRKSNLHLQRTRLPQLACSDPSSRRRGRGRPPLRARNG